MMEANTEFSLEDKERTIGARLSCYASGSGSLSFVYDRAGKATGDRVTVRDVKWYVKNRAPHLSHYMVGRFGEGPIFLFRPVYRTAPDELQIAGRVYRYEKAGEHILFLFDPNDGHQVKNMNTLAVVKFYLEHEQELDGLIHRGGL